MRPGQLFVCIIAAVASLGQCEKLQKLKPKREFCSGIDVTDLLKLSFAQLDGLWYTQWALTTVSRPEEISFTWWEQQGTKEFIVERTKTKCKTFGFRNVQRQTAEYGPFSPCLSGERIFPTTREALDIIYTPLNDNVMFLYRCRKLRSDGSCSEPNSWVVSKSPFLRKDDLRIVKATLPHFGLTPEMFNVLKPELNDCPRPEVSKRSSRRTYGRGRIQSS